MYKALLVPSTLPITHSMHYLVSTSHTKSLCMEPIPVHTCTRTRKSFDKESMRKGLNRGGDEARKWGTKGERNQGRVRREKRGKMRGEGRMRRRVCRYLWLVFSASEQIKPILVHFNKNLLRRAVSLVKNTTPMHQQQIAHTWPTKLLYAIIIHNHCIQALMCEHMQYPPRAVHSSVHWGKRAWERLLTSSHRHK